MITCEINFTTLKLPYEKGEWRDADQRIFDACFIILGQYVEEELGSSEDAGSSHKGYRLHSDDKGEPLAIDLWLWYRDELPILQKSYSDHVKACFIKRYHKYPHEHPEIIKDQKLRELIEIRRGRWT